MLQSISYASEDAALDGGIEAAPVALVDGLLEVLPVRVDLEALHVLGEGDQAEAGAGKKKRVRSG